MIVSIILILAGCKKEVELPEALTTSVSNLENSFNILHDQMATVAHYMASINLDTTQIRARLIELYSNNPKVAEFSWVNKDGILKMIEPPVYYSDQGSDISQQEHIIKAAETKEPVLGLSFLAVEGFYAVAVLHPIVDSNTYLGSVATLLKTKEFLGDIMEPLLSGQEFELWVMEKGGYMIYNQDDIEIGLNVFTDPYYKDFPDFITACEKINKNESGTTQYTFYKTGTNNPVTKLTYWTTFERYGTEWKVVWVKPE